MARVPSMARLRLPLILVSAVTVMVLLGVGIWRANQDPCFSLIIPSICRVQVSEPLVALTFDDGPTSIGVDIALDALEKRNISATFLLIGRGVSQRPDLAARIAKAGHELGNHSFSHVPMVGRSRQFYDQEISETNRLLRLAGGRSNLFRPPYGQKRVGLPLALRRHSLTMVLWDIDDWPATDPQALAADVVAARTTPWNWRRPFLVRSIGLGPTPPRARGDGPWCIGSHETQMHQRDFDPDGVEKVLSVVGLLLAVATAVAIPLLASMSA